MRPTFLLLVMAFALGSVTSPPARADKPAPAVLRHSRDCLLEAVLRYKRLPLRSELPLPPVFLESQTPLRQFQDAIEPQWGLRPDSFLNAYIVAKNEIYLIDEAEYYAKHRRFVDDSLAHELAHYVQVKYQNANLAEDPSLEDDAIAVQTHIRTEYLEKGISPCGRP